MHKFPQLGEFTRPSTSTSSSNLYLIGFLILAAVAGIVYWLVNNIEEPEEEDLSKESLAKMPVSRVRLS